MLLVLNVNDGNSADHRLQKMCRDIKLNFYQHSKAQLKKKCKIYMEHYKGGRFDPVHGSAAGGQPGDRVAAAILAAEESDCESEEEAVEGIFQDSSDADSSGEDGDDSEEDSE